MQIVDADTHISMAKIDKLAIGVNELIVRMDKADVEKALVWLHPPYDRNVTRENHGVYQATQKFPDRLLGFGWANPRLGMEKASEEIKRCIEEFGFYGVKFNGAQDDYKIDEPQILELIAKVIEYNKLVAFHIGADSYENTHPFRLAKIAKQFPEATFLMIHIGGAVLPPLDKAAVEVALAHPNIYLIGSSIPGINIVEALDKLGPERICFGSDTPFRLMHVQVAKYLALLRDFDQEDTQKVMGGNIAQLFGISI